MGPGKLTLSGDSPAYYDYSDTIVLDVPAGDTYRVCVYYRATSYRHRHTRMPGRESTLFAHTSPAA